MYNSRKYTGMEGVHEGYSFLSSESGKSGEVDKGLEQSRCDFEIKHRLLVDDGQAGASNSLSPVEASQDSLRIRSGWGEGGIPSPIWELLTPISKGGLLSWSPLH